MCILNLLLCKDKKNLPYVYPFKIFTPKQAEYLKGKREKKKECVTLEGRAKS